MLLLSVVIVFLQPQLLLFSTFQSSLIKLLKIRRASSRKNFTCTTFAFNELSLEGQIVFHILISLFGIAIIYRNLSLLEKFEVINKQKMFLCFIFLQLPLFLFVIFKEQIAFTLLYIGIFLLTLIFYRKIFLIFAQSTYVNCHLRVLDHLILILKSGKSAQVGIKIVFNGFSEWEKIVFGALESIFELQKQEVRPTFDVNSFYFEEMKLILRSNHRIVEQLLSFREGLRIRYNLRRRSRQVTQQIRAQALVSVLIYCVFLYVSFSQFHLQKQPMFFFISSALFVFGLFLIFKLGGQIRWKT